MRADMHFILLTLYYIIFKANLYYGIKYALWEIEKKGNRNIKIYLTLNLEDENTKYKR